jgi:hypothetical protein
MQQHVERSAGGQALLAIALIYLVGVILLAVVWRLLGL